MPPSNRRVQIVAPNSYFHGKRGLVITTKLDSKGTPIVEVQLDEKTHTLNFYNNEVEDLPNHGNGMQQLIETTKERKAIG